MNEEVQTPDPSVVTAVVVIGVVATLLIAWCVTVAVVVPPEIRPGFGGCLLLLGLLNLALHRRFGSQALSGGRRLSRLWDDLGERARIVRAPPS